MGRERVKGDEAPAAPAAPAAPVGRKLLDLVEQKVEDPRYEDLAAHFFAAAGGTAAVAKLLHDEFMAAKPGGMLRQRILDMVLRSAKYGSEKAAPLDPGMLDDQDLERELLDLLGKVAGKEERRGKGKRD